MRFRIIPKENITINVSKNNEETFALLRKVIKHHNGSNTQFESSSNGFVIERTLHNNSRTTITANGAIINEGKNNSLRLEITAKDNYLIGFAIFWYVINLLIFLLTIFVSISKGHFNFYFLVPLLFIFLGYGFSTAMIQGAMDELIGEVKKAVE